MVKIPDLVIVYCVIVEFFQILLAFTVVKTKKAFIIMLLIPVLPSVWCMLSTVTELFKEVITSIPEHYRKLK